MSFPTPLAGVNPSGGLIYSGSSVRNIASGTDTDSFTIPLDAGQTITVLADPASTLQPTVELRGPDGTLLGTATSPGAGKDAVVTAPAGLAGLYTLTIGSAAGTVGQYTVQVTLNAALESESHDGAADNTAATAQNLNGSFISLGGTASRGAVLGTADSSGGDYYSFTLNAGDSLTAALTGLTSGTVHLSLTDASGTVLALGAPGATNLTEAISNFSVTAGGQYCVFTPGTSGVNYSVVLTRNASLDTEPNNSKTSPQILPAAGGQVLGFVASGVMGGSSMGLIQDTLPMGVFIQQYGRGPTRVHRHIDPLVFPFNGQPVRVQHDRPSG